MHMFRIVISLVCVLAIGCTTTSTSSPVTPVPALGPVGYEVAAPSEGRAALVVYCPSKSGDTMTILTTPTSNHTINAGWILRKEANERGYEPPNVLCHVRPGGYTVCELPPGDLMVFTGEAKTAFNTTASTSTEWVSFIADRQARVTLQEGKTTFLRIDNSGFVVMSEAAATAALRELRKQQ